MKILTALETAKIAIHWDHIRAPSDPERGILTDNSCMGVAKRVAGLVLFGILSRFIGVKLSLFCLTFGGAYHCYKAYKKYCVLHQKMAEKQREVGNQQGIDALLAAVEQGKKIGLIIGRESEQPVPQDPDILWASGNLQGNPAALAGRVHVQMDFNDLESCKKLTGLFDIVVVDWSTLKFMKHNPWRRFAQMLRPLSSSQLVTETSAGDISYSDIDKIVAEASQGGEICYPLKNLLEEGENNQRLFDTWKAQFSEEEYLSQFEAYVRSKSPDRKGSLGEEERKRFEISHFYYILNTEYPDRYNSSQEAIKEAEVLFQRDLQRFFDCVKIIRQSPYPTSEGILDGQKCDYFVLSGPKSRVFPSRATRVN